MQYGANGLAFVQQVEGLVDLFERQVVGDEVVDVEGAVHVVVDIAGQLAAALDATKRRAAPDTTGDQLERTRFDGLAGAGDTDNGGFAPALVAALQRAAHDLGVADAFERGRHAAVGHVDDGLLDRRVAMVFRVDAIRGAELAGKFELGRIEVDDDNARRLGHDRALHYRQADGAETEHGHGVAGLDLGGVEHRAHPGGDATAEQTDLVQRRVLAHLGQRDFRQHGVFGERGGAHVVV